MGEDAMADEHISEESLGRFLRTEVSREEGKQIVGHLLSGCPLCSEIAIRMTSELGLWSPKASGSTRWEEAYEEVFRRALAFASEREQRLAVEKLRGWAQWAQLEPLNPQLRFGVVEADKSFHMWGLYDRLLEASRWYIRTEPAEAVDIVRLAIFVAERLNTEEIGNERVADLRAHAWAALGNARRLASDFEGARRAFNEAWKILEDGTGDPAEEGRILSLEASYMKDIGEFELAESALEEALEQFKKTRDLHEQGRIHLQMGEVIGYINPERGITHIRRALALIAATQEPRLELCAQHDLAWFLNDADNAEEALAVLDRARPLYRQFPDKWTQLRLHWLEGRIAHHIGEYAQAESIFGQIWEEFRVRNLNHELVLVSIDLAQALTRKGEPSRAAELVTECYPIMKNWGMHKDALAAWLIFRDALGQGSMGNIFRRIEGYYRRYWFMPAKFDPGIRG
jgi:tetratricopeptide (TPR) repeat protein